MMQLKGRLQLTTLGDLLGALYREHLSGTLELTEEKGPTAGRVHALHLVRGQIVQVDSAGAVAHLGELLAEFGWLDRSALPALVEQAKRSNLPLGQRLVEAGLLPGDAVLQALRAQIRRRLDALFCLEDARVAFRLVLQRRRELDVARPLGPEEYLVGRPRARDRHRTANSVGTDESAEIARRRALIVLGLGAGADEAMIRGAFRRLARSLHPDLHPRARPEQIEDLRRRFADVSAAYHRLAG
jgi:hypothetical protein